MMQTNNLVRLTLRDVDGHQPVHEALYASLRFIRLQVGQQVTTLTGV